MNTNDRRNKVTRTFNTNTYVYLKISSDFTCIEEYTNTFIEGSREEKMFLKTNPTIKSVTKASILYGMDYATFLRYAEVIEL